MGMFVVPLLSMTTTLYPFLVPLFLLIPLFLVFKRSRSNYSKLSLPPSPPRLPIIGNLHQLGTHPHRSFKALSDKYGPLMRLHLGQTPTIVVSSADMVREIIKTHDIVFSSRPKMTAANLLFYGSKDIAFSPYSEYWRQVRKLCVLELLSLRRVQQFHFVREEEAAVLVDRIRRAHLITSKAFSINLSELLTATSHNIVCRIVLGQSFEEKDGQVFGRLTRAVMVHLMAFSVGDFFPSLRWIDDLRGFTSRVKATFRQLNNFFDKVVKEHKAALVGSDGRREKKDFVDILLGLQKDGTPEFELSDDNMKALIMDMFVGGTDTSLTALEWTMAELLRDPRAIKKAQEEVRAVVGKKAKVEINDVNQMVYLKCVIRETLRLHPPVPLLLPRETTASVEIGGYHIPANMRVLINAWAIQRDPSSWDRPEEFIPERFENCTVDFKGQDFEFIPFGSGRRGCPGLTFGVTSTEYIIANLLYWFDWKLPTDGGDISPEKLDMSEVYGLTVYKKVPLHLVPIPYSP